VAGYVYRGDQPAAPGSVNTVEWSTSPRKPRFELPPFDPTFCGSMKGYRQHRSHGQQQCRECLDAHNVYCAAYKAGKRADKARI
jgi:hypothetical protein